MNSQQVSGVVEGIGEKFNGSLKVAGKWLNFAKGKKVDVKVGEIVTLELTPWDFNGKSGVNVTSVQKNGTTAKVETVSKSSSETISPQPQKSRDFDAENRGKTRCQLVAASMQLVLTDSITVEKLKATVDVLVDYIFDGK